MTRYRSIPWRKIKPQEQSAAFCYVRESHQRETAEDYVELIAELVVSRGEARAVDLAECLGISAATVNRTIARLQREGYLVTEPYRAIFLTAKGEALAESMRRRHQIVYEFLRAIGVSEQNARLDSEGVEHHVGDETLACFEALIKKLPLIE